MHLKSLLYGATRGKRAVQPQGSKLIETKVACTLPTSVVVTCNKENVIGSCALLQLHADSFSIKQMLGKGSFATVYECEFNRERFALKQFKLAKKAAKRAQVEDDFDREVEILRSIDHAAIVSLQGFVKEPNSLQLLLELCDTDVSNYLGMVRRGETTMTWMSCMTVAQDCIRGVEYLHSLRPKIIHRDLKAANLLLTVDMRCKLTDFGLSRRMEGDGRRSMTACGTLCWVAPEVLRGENYDESIDVYAYGIVLWELFSAEKPYEDIDTSLIPHQVSVKGVRPDPMAHLPGALNVLMADCWHHRPQARPKCTEVRSRLVEIDFDFDFTQPQYEPAVWPRFGG
mmetsp:Transcript_2060/g.3383  ORF Transcript_2060/g.3383 Transcript_2060/m.3383 type:complete len:342 (+) Transcript_2060:152-1177(+)